MLGAQLQRQGALQARTCSLKKRSSLALRRETSGKNISQLSGRPIAGDTLLARVNAIGKKDPEIRRGGPFSPDTGIRGGQARFNTAELRRI